MNEELMRKIERMELELSELKQLARSQGQAPSNGFKKRWKKRILIPLAVFATLIMVGLAMAADVPHSFGTGGVISATKFNENFTYIVDRLWDLNGSALYYNGGNVGIGTASPLELLHVNNDSGSTQVRVCAADGWGPSQRMYSGSDFWAFWQRGDNNRFQLGYNTGVSLTMDTLGNVGIGPAGPGSRLEVKGSGSTNATAGLNVTNSAGTSGLYVRDDGNVGIGTASPTSLLHVQGSSFTTLTAETTATSGSYAALALKGGQPNAYWSMGTSHDSVAGNPDSLYFYKNAGTTGTKLVIQDNGNVGIGTTSPSSKLDVVGIISQNGVSIKAPETVCVYSSNLGADSTMTCPTGKFIVGPVFGGDFFATTESNCSAVQGSAKPTPNLRLDDNSSATVNDYHWATFG